MRNFYLTIAIVLLALPMEAAADKDYDRMEAQMRRAFPDHEYVHRESWSPFMFDFNQQVFIDPVREGVVFFVEIENKKAREIEEFNDEWVAGYAFGNLMGMRQRGVDWCNDLNSTGFFGVQVVTPFVDVFKNKVYREVQSIKISRGAICRINWSQFGEDLKSGEAFLRIAREYKMVGYQPDWGMDFFGDKFHYRAPTREDRLRAGARQAVKDWDVVVEVVEEEMAKPKKKR